MLDEERKSQITDFLYSIVNQHAYDNLRPNTGQVFELIAPNVAAKLVKENKSQFLRTASTVS